MLTGMKLFSGALISRVLALGLLGTLAGAQHEGHNMPMPMTKPPQKMQVEPTPVGVSITGAFVAAQPPVATDTALFLTLKNTSKAPLTLVGGTSPLAAEAMLMKFVKLPNGQTSMKMVDNFVLAAGQSLTLSPGGKHLMLMGLKAPLKIGQMVPVSLQFAGGGVLHINAVVKKF